MLVNAILVERTLEKQRHNGDRFTPAVIE